MILYEHRGSKSRLGNKVRLLPYAELEGKFGYRSVYGFNEEVIDLIQLNEGTYGLAGLPMYSDELLVDFDDAPEAAYAMAEDLYEFSFTLWESGGRSIHLHVDIEPMESPDVPIIQKSFMQYWFPLADMSIYKTSGMFRLPGTYHEKNPGKRKILIDKNEGKTLRIEMPEGREVPIPIPRLAADGDPEMLSKSLDSLLLQSGLVGGRNHHTYRIAATCRDLGEPYPYAVELAKQWNRLMCNPPLPPAEVETAVQSAYRGKV